MADRQAPILTVVQNTGDVADWRSRRCVSCRYWYDDIADRKCPEVHGECQHPDIAEKLMLYDFDPLTYEFAEKPEPFYPNGEFGCVLWERHHG